MGKTGVVRGVDDLGRVVLPIEIRRSLGIGHTDPVAFYVDEERIVLRKHYPVCVICGNPGGSIAFRDKMVCSACVADARRTVLESESVTPVHSR